MECGTLERHSRRTSSGREEIVVVDAAAVAVAVAESGEGWWGCWGLAKQDFMSHEKCRELQVSDVDDDDDM